MTRCSWRLDKTTYTDISDVILIHFLINHFSCLMFYFPCKLHSTRCGQTLNMYNVCIDDSVSEFWKKNSFFSYRFPWEMEEISRWKRSRESIIGNQTLISKWKWVSPQTKADILPQSPFNFFISICWKQTNQTIKFLPHLLPLNTISRLW